MYHTLQIKYLKKILKWVNKHSGLSYKQILCNWYENGNHYIGPHSDDETQLVKNSAIYSFSFGQERDFVIKSKKRIIKDKEGNDVVENHIDTLFVCHIIHLLLWVGKCKNITNIQYQNVHYQHVPNAA